MKLVALDIETSDSRGASLEYFRRDFKVDSLSLAWHEGEEIKHWFSENPMQITQMLAILAQKQTPIIVHNLAFEYGVLTSKYPHLKLNYVADTMRLAQLWDAGGPEYADMEEFPLTPDQMIEYELGSLSDDDIKRLANKTKGMSLEACARRFLPEEYHNHKSMAADYLREHHGIKAKFGQYLHLLPTEILEEYNNKDTEITLLLYHELTEYLNSVQFDSAQDWKLYTLRVRLMREAYVKGIKVNRDALYEYIVSIESEIAQIEQEFRTKYADSLDKLAELKLENLMDTWVRGEELKKEEARLQRWLRVITGQEDKRFKEFNINSGAQLGQLFVDVMGMTPKFLSPKGAPSLKATHLHQFGDAGNMLKKRKKRILVLQQCINVYLASAYDGRVHCNIKVAGTRTNRVAGGI